jgi:hypothetical protein
VELSVNNKGAAQEGTSISGVIALVEDGNKENRRSSRSSEARV